jgi:hypothetical protein
MEFRSIGPRRAIRRRFLQQMNGEWRDGQDVLHTARYGANRGYDAAV